MVIAIYWAVMAMSPMANIAGAAIAIVTNYRGEDAYALDAGITRACIAVITFFWLIAAGAVRALFGCAQVSVIAIR